LVEIVDVLKTLKPVKMTEFKWPEEQHGESTAPTGDLERIRTDRNRFRKKPIRP